MRASAALVLALAASPAAASQWGKPLRFRADGTFKLVEVSDVHHTGNLFCTDISKAQEKYPCSDGMYPRQNPATAPNPPANSP